MKKIEETFSAQPVNQELLQNAKDLLGQLTETIEKGIMSEKRPAGKSYLDMVTDLHTALDANNSLPPAVKDTVIRHLQMIKTILGQYKSSWSRQK